MRSGCLAFFTAFRRDAKDAREKVDESRLFSRSQWINPFQHLILPMVNFDLCTCRLKCLVSFTLLFLKLYQKVHEKRHWLLHYTQEIQCTPSLLKPTAIALKTDCCVLFFVVCLGDNSFDSVCICKDVNAPFLPKRQWTKWNLPGQRTPHLTDMFWLHRNGRRLFKEYLHSFCQVSRQKTSKQFDFFHPSRKRRMRSENALIEMDRNVRVSCSFLIVCDDDDDDDDANVDMDSMRRTDNAWFSYQNSDLMTSRCEFQMQILLVSVYTVQRTELIMNIIRNGPYTYVMPSPFSFFARFSSYSLQWEFSFATLKIIPGIKETNSI